MTTIPATATIRKQNGPNFLFHLPVFISKLITVIIFRASIVQPCVIDTRMSDRKRNAPYIAVTTGDIEGWEENRVYLMMGISLSVLMSTKEIVTVYVPRPAGRKCRDIRLVGRSCYRKPKVVKFILQS